MDAAAIALRKAYDLFNSGKKEAGMLEASKVASKYPQEPKVQMVAAQLLLAGKRASDAAILYERALAIDPENPKILSLLGGAYFSLEEFERARVVLTEASLLDPTDAMVHSQLSQTLLVFGDIDQAFDHAGHAFALNPLDERIVQNYAHCMLLLDHFEGLDFLMNAVRDRPSALELPTDLSGAQLYCETLEESQVLANLRLAGERYSNWIPARDHSRHDYRVDRKVRIGILSSELRRHSVAGFLAPFLKNLDQTKLEVFLYSSHQETDDYTKALKRAHQWRPVSGLSPEEICTKIQADQIDILAETHGWFDGTKPVLIAMKPAPLIMHMIGFPHTIGSKRVDLRLGNDFVDTKISEAQYAEAVAKIEGPFLCYEPLHEMPDIPTEKNVDRMIVFGSFNNCQKLQPRMLRCWKSLLDSIPGSRLVLKTNQIREKGYLASMSRAIEAAGLTDRTDILPTTRTIEEHLECYSQVDIALDTHPYSGTTTTFEALMMGVPVVTLIGETHRSRVTAMILREIGRSGWIADDLDEYQEIARKLADDIQGIRKGKQALRNDLFNSKLFDGPDYARRMENLLLNIWRQKCEEVRDHSDAILAEGGKL